MNITHQREGNIRPISRRDEGLYYDCYCYDKPSYRRFIIQE